MSTNQNADILYVSNKCIIQNGYYIYQSENSKTSDTHKLLLNVTDKINLKRSDKYVALSNLSIYYTWKNIKELCKTSKFKMSVPTWNNEFE